MRTNLVQSRFRLSFHYGKARDIRVCHRHRQEWTRRFARQPHLRVLDRPITQTGLPAATSSRSTGDPANSSFSDRQDVKLSEN
jgi:hypothetical protein